MSIKNKMYAELNQNLHLGSRGYASKVYDYILSKISFPNTLLVAYLPIARRTIENGLFVCSIECLGDEIITFTNEHINLEIIVLLEGSKTDTIDPLAECLVNIANKLIKHLEETYPLISK